MTTRRPFTTSSILSNQVQKCKIINDGRRTEIWIDGHMISEDVESFWLHQDASNIPILTLSMKVEIVPQELEIDGEPYVEIAQ